MLGLAGRPPQALSVPGSGLEEQSSETLIIQKHSSINLADDRAWPDASGSDLIVEDKEQEPFPAKAVLPSLSTSIPSSGISPDLLK